MPWSSYFFRGIHPVGVLSTLHGAEATGVDAGGVEATGSGRSPNWAWSDIARFFQQVGFFPPRSVNMTASSPSSPHAASWTLHSLEGVNPEDAVVSVNTNKNKVNGMMQYVFNIVSPYYLKPLIKLSFLWFVGGS
jgi:hypothetical protein